MQTKSSSCFQSSIGSFHSKIDESTGIFSESGPTDVQNSRFGTYRNIFCFLFSCPVNEPSYTLLLKTIFFIFSSFTRRYYIAARYKQRWSTELGLIARREGCDCFDGVKECSSKLKIGSLKKAKFIVFGFYILLCSKLKKASR